MSGEGVGCMVPRLGKPTVCVLAGSLPLGHFLEGLFNETVEQICCSTRQAWT